MVTTDLSYASSWTEIPAGTFKGESWATIELNGETACVWKEYVLSKIELTIAGETIKNINQISLGEDDSYAISVGLFGENLNFDCEIVSGAEYVTYANGGLTPVSVGEAIVKVSYTLFGEEIEREIALEIVLPTQIYEVTAYYSANDKTIYFNDENGKVVGLEKFFGAEYELVGGYEGTTALTVNQNGLTGVTTNEGETTEITVFVANRGVKFTNVIVARQVINEASDLAIFDFTLEKAGYTEAGQKETTVTAWTLDGYYVLLADLDATSYVMEHLGFGKKNSEGKTYFYELQKSGFIGTFEGNGHTLKATVADYGLFGAILSGAHIQNLALELFLTSSASTRASAPSLLGYYVTGGENISLANIYIKPTYTSGFDETRGNVCLSASIGNVNLDYTVVDWSNGYKFNAESKGALLTVAKSSTSYSRMQQVHFICSTTYKSGETQLPMPLIYRSDLSGFTWSLNDNAETTPTQISGDGKIYRYDNAEGFELAIENSSNSVKKTLRWRNVDGAWTYVTNN